MKNYRNVLKKYGAFLFGAVLVFSLTSCNNDDDDDYVAPPVAYVSLYHASPNASGLNIIVDNRQINSYPFSYSQNTGYRRFYTGARDLKFTPYNANNSVVDTTTTFEPGRAYSVFITGSYPSIEALILEDNSDQPAAGSAKLRIVHLSPDAPALDIFAQSDEAALVEAQDYKSASEFLEVDAGLYDFDVKDQEGNTLLNVDDISISSGIYYTLVVKGFSTPPNGNENYLSAEVLVN